MQRRGLRVVGDELREGIGGGFLEARLAALEDEADAVGGAIALLGDKQLGLIALFGQSINFEEVGPIDEHDDVGVLLDGAGFAEVGELRAALVTLGCAGELAENEDGDLQLFGEAFRPRVMLETSSLRFEKRPRALMSWR